MTRSWLVILALLVALAGCQTPEESNHSAAGPPNVEHRPTPEQRYLDWAQPRFDTEVYAARRRRLAARLRASGGGVFLAPSQVGRSHGGTFRQLDDFLYFTGLELSDALLTIDADEGAVAIYTPKGDPRFESLTRRNDFPGMPLIGDADLARVGGIELRPLRELEADLATWVETGRAIRLHVPTAPALELPEEPWVFAPPPEEALLARLHRELPDARLVSAREDVARLRMVKGPEELAVMQRAADITAAAIVEAAGFVRDGVDERTLEAELEASFKRLGSQRAAFASIIKSGPNSLWPWRILASRYDRRNRTMHDGELVILDVGCELDHYVSDVGRTFPVSGRFTDHQRATLEMVTRVVDAVVAAVRPGVTLADLQRVAFEEIPVAERPYMQAGLYFGHHLGLDVGDPFAAGVPLEPGMVFTIEPWYYDHDRDVAVFLEEEVVVTADGCSVLTAGLARTPEALESLVRK